MTKNSTNEFEFAGPYMIQDRDHLSAPVTDKAPRGTAKQADQAQASSRQVNGKTRTGQRQAH